MSGAGTLGAGQHAVCRQSTGVGQPALNEKSTLASCESMPGGGSGFLSPATRVRVYGEKSPVASRTTVMVNGSLLAGGSMLVTVGVVSPVMTTLAGVRARLRASLRNVTARRVPQPAAPGTSR